MMTCEYAVYFRDTINRRILCLKSIKTDRIEVECLLDKIYTTLKKGEKNFHKSVTKENALLPDNLLLF